MKIIKYIKYSVCACFCMGIAACNLDPELTDQYSIDTPFTSEKNLQLYINQFYPILGSNYYNGALQEDAYADISKENSPNTTGNQWAYGELTINADSNPFNSWGWAHTWVIGCCKFLDKLEMYKDNFSPEFVKRAEAEVRFFRAYMYMGLLERYGTGILYEKLPALNEKDHPLCDTEKLQDFVYNEYDFCKKNLPKDADQGKLTQGAALGMQARAMLFAKRWKAASDACEELFALKKYELNQNYADMFKFRRTDGRINPESIIEYGYKYKVIDYSFDYFNCPPGDGGYSNFSPTDNLVSQYEMADGSAFDWNDSKMAKYPYEGREERFYATILYNNCDWKKRKVEIWEGGRDGFAIGGSATSTGYYLRKFMDEDLDVMRNTDLTFYTMRLAEVYLIYAEAMAQQGYLDKAMEYIYKIRNRAKLTNKINVQTLDKFMEVLRHERMIELAFEGHRFQDLRRWDLAVKELNGIQMEGVKPIKNDDGTFTYERVKLDNGKKRVYLDKYKRFPLPTSEVKNNDLVDQFEEWR